MEKTTKYDYWVSYMFICDEGGHWEWGNDHVNIFETYSGIEWVREIEGRICRRCKYSKVTLINFVPLVIENKRAANKS
ncbi:hypothetical protein D0U04_06315 [Bacillus clarus]|uniref:Uncharacterized protein n=1 Tax=Bacillus clarus TaxID=2338372 RepID=A0ABX9KYC8_9BACI|nr:hypothetical protein [Bacillus clarus]RFT67710.1 hypothetical protein D0U04_06315 [Bacillus clarus]